MNFLQSIQHVLSNYVNFQGRAARPEFWWFVLFYMLMQIAGAVLDALMFPGSIGLVGILAALVLFLPYLAVGARRLHDTNRSGWWLVISIVPFIGFIVLIVLFIQRGTQGPNRFGEPHHLDATQGQLTP